MSEDSLFDRLITEYDKAVKNNDEEQQDKIHGMMRRYAEMLEHELARRAIECPEDYVEEEEMRKN